MLVLPIKKKWFDMIKSGEKKEEYREIKPYWFTRFKNNLMIYEYDWLGDCVEISKGRGTVIFKNGYQKNAPKIKCGIEITKGVIKLQKRNEKAIEYIHNHQPVFELSSKEQIQEWFEKEYYVNLLNILQGGNSNE